MITTSHSGSSATRSILPHDQSAGSPLDDLADNASASMRVDRKAFAALMHHLAKCDSPEHTLLLISGRERVRWSELCSRFLPCLQPRVCRTGSGYGRQALKRRPGSWAEISDLVDEALKPDTGTLREQRRAGKKARLQQSLLLQCVAAYPPGEFPERPISVLGLAILSDRPNQFVIPIWKATTPAIDAIGPDLYSSARSWC